MRKNIKCCYSHTININNVTVATLLVVPLHVLVSLDLLHRFAIWIPSKAPTCLGTVYYIILRQQNSSQYDTKLT